MNYLKMDSYLTLLTTVSRNITANKYKLETQHFINNFLKIIIWPLYIKYLCSL